MVWKKAMQTTLFWGCIALLLSSSIFYGFNANRIVCTSRFGANFVSQELLNKEGLKFFSIESNKRLLSIQDISKVVFETAVG